MADKPPSALPNTWESEVISAYPTRWKFSHDLTAIVHTRSARDAARGQAILPLGKIFSEYLLTFRVPGDGIGCIGVMDGSAEWTPNKRRGGAAWGVELLDGNWRACSNANTSAEQRGSLLDRAIDTPGARVRIKVVCAERKVAVALDDEANFASVPVPIPQSVACVRPWAVSTSERDTFQLLSVEAKGRLPWSPSSHANFPPRVRAFACNVLRTGYAVAAAQAAQPQLHGQEEGAFVQVWIEHVLPAVINGMSDAELLDELTDHSVITTSGEPGAIGAAAALEDAVALS